MNTPPVDLLSRQRQCRVAMCGRDNRWRHLSGKPTSKQVLPWEPWKTTTLIGQVWKRSNARSLLVLIVRSAWLLSLSMSNLDIWYYEKDLQRAWGLPQSRKLQRAWGLPHSRKAKQRAWGLPHSRQQKHYVLIPLFFAGLVALAGRPYPIPSRTRP